MFNPHLKWRFLILVPAVVAAVLALQLVPGCQFGGDSIAESTVSPSPEALGNVSVTRPSLDLPKCPVRVIDAYTYKDGIRVEVEPVGDQVRARYVDFAVWSYDDIAGLGVTVYDAHGKLKWDMSLETDGTTHRASEMTGDERLEITRTSLPKGLFSETYELTVGVDVTREDFTFDPRSADDLQRCRREWRKFWPKGTHLDNNPEGLMAVQLLRSHEFAVWMGNKLVGPDNPYDSIDDIPIDPMSAFEKICIIADLCAWGKCLFGGMVNPICHACGGVAIACELARLICWIIGC